MKRVWIIAGLSALAACSQGPVEGEPEAIPSNTETTVPRSGAPEPASQPVSGPETNLAENKNANSAICKADETPIFACGFANGKRVAVCGLADGGAEYRFGGKEPELTVNGGEWASVPYSGGGEAQIQFSNGDTNYIVFSRIVRTNFAEGEPNNPAINDGIVIERSGEFVGLLTCDGNSEVMPVQYTAAEKHLLRADDLFSQNTGRVDPP